MPQIGWKEVRIVTPEYQWALASWDGHRLAALLKRHDDEAATYAPLLQRNEVVGQTLDAWSWANRRGRRSERVRA